VCGADAVLKPLTGELSTWEAEAFLGGLVDFGGPPYELMATRGDPQVRGIGNSCPFL